MTIGRRAVTSGLHTLIRDISAPAAWAGLTAFVWYAFGAVPLQIAVSGQLGLSPAQASSWMFIVWFSGAVSSVLLSLYFRIPIPVTWTIPGLIYLGTLAGTFTFAELVGASLVAGLLIVALGLLGLGERIMKWLPLPIIMGMFAGSILGYATGAVKATVGDALVGGATVAGYLVGRLIGSRRLPPVGVAVASGALGASVAGKFTPSSIVWSLPTLVVPEMHFTLPAIVTVSLPLVILSMALGNIQGLGFLLGQGYRVPVKPITVVVGINSVVNAFLGGHPAIIARTGVAILAGPDAGPLATRYWANLVAATMTVAIALASSPILSLLGILPRSYIVALAGLAVLSSLQDAFEKSFGGKMRFGALVAFAVAATPFGFLGITSDFWAVPAGLAATLCAERRELMESWRGKASAAG